MPGRRARGPAGRTRRAGIDILARSPTQPRSPNFACPPFADVMTVMDGMGRSDSMGEVGEQDGSVA